MGPKKQKQTVKLLVLFIVSKRRQVWIDTRQLHVWHSALMQQQSPTRACAVLTSCRLLISEQLQSPPVGNFRLTLVLGGTQSSRTHARTHRCRQCLRPDDAAVSSQFPLTLTSRGATGASPPSAHYRRCCSCLVSQQDVSRAVDEVSSIS